MADNFSRYEEWTIAQAAAFTAESRLAQAALRHAAGAGPAPGTVDLQGALILRCKASALLTAMVSGAARAEPDEGLPVPAAGDRPHDVP